MQEHIKVSLAVQKSFNVVVDNSDMIQYTDKQLEEVIKAYETILDLCDGVFTAHQECMLMDMKDKFKEELDKREMEDYGI